MKSSRLFFATLVAVPTLLHCASSDSSNPGPKAGDAGPGDNKPAVARTFCEGTGGATKTFSKLVGQSCGAGSNKPLCVVEGSTACDDDTVCLWDSAGLGGKNAYCTVECTPGDTTSCPSGYVCKADQCTGSATPNICVMTTAVKPPTSSCTEVPELKGLSMNLVIPLREEGATIIVASGSTYGAGFQGVFRVKDEAVEEIGTVSISTLLGVVGDEVWLNQASGKAARIKGTTIDTFTLDVCGATTGCSSTDYSAVARDAAGAVSFVARTTKAGKYGSYNATLGDGSEIVLGEELPDLDAKRSLGNHLDDGSIVSQCIVGASLDPRSICFTSDLLKWESLDLPKGASWTYGAKSIIGASKDDLILLSDEGVVHRYKGGKWTSDDLPGAKTAAQPGFSRAGDRLFITRMEITGSKSYELTDDCWKEASGGTISDSLSNEEYVDYSTGRRCVYPLPK